MRDLLLIGFIGTSLVAVLRYPFLGLLLWGWFTLATPQAGAYLAMSLPLNMVIAAVTLIAFVLHSEFARFRAEPILLLTLAFAGWIILSQVFSLDPENSHQYADRFVKVLTFIILAMVATTTKLRFHALLWLFAIVMGFYGAKGGAFTIATLAQGLYEGLPDTILADNNHMGIALAASLPLFLYLREQSANRLVRLALLITLGLSIFAVLGTHSRGAFVSLLVFGFFLWLRSRHKILIAAAMLVAAIPAYFILPSHWFERMETIAEADEDESFMGRVDAWVINWKLAQAHPLTGAGLRNSYEEEIARTVDPERVPRAAHSIYFEVLGGTGFVGLFLYLSILGTAFLKAAYANVKYRYDPAGRWRGRFGHFAQVSLATFGVGAASVSMEMWEGYLLIIALVSVLSKVGAHSEGSVPRHLNSKVRDRLRPSVQQAAARS